MGEEILDLLTYEAIHIGLNAVSFAFLTPLFRWLADLIHWFPKQDVHYFILMLLFVYSISYDKRYFSLQPSFFTQAIRLSVNLLLVFGSTYVFGMLCQSKLQIGGGVDPEEATQNLKCMGGVVGGAVVSFIFRLFTLGFLRSVMICIQVFINMYYAIGLYYI